MDRYNNNASWHSNMGQDPYHFQAGQNGDRIAPTTTSEGFIDATPYDEGNDFGSSGLDWSNSSQDNRNDHSNLAATGYHPFNRKPYVHEPLAASPSYEHESQYSESNPQLFIGDVTGQASFPWNNPFQQTTALPGPPRAHYTSHYERNVSSQEASAPARFDPSPGTIHGGTEQEFLPEVDDESTQYNRGGVPYGGAANTTTNHWVGPSLTADQVVHQDFRRVNEYQGYTEAQPNVMLNPRPYILERTSLVEYTGASPQRNMPTRCSEAPWSAVNTRRQELRDSLEDITSRIDWNAGSSETMSGVTGCNNTESIFTDDLDISVTSLNSEVDMMRSLETLRPENQSFENQTSRMDHHHTPLAQDFLMEVRASTPPCPEDNMNLSSQSAENSIWLPVPQSHAPTFEASSPGSTVSSSMPEIIHCLICRTPFSGDYRKGNLARHNRQKHGGKGVIQCEDEFCFKTFERKDARLKHYRRNHPHLAQRPIVPRGPQSSRRPSRSPIPVSGHESQEQALSNISTWT